MASAAPDQIDLRRHRDWEGRTYERWLPNGLFGLICIIPVLALFNVFGQAPEVHKGDLPNGASPLDPSAQTTVRSGLIFQARFDIRARREIKGAVLVLDSDWLE